MRDIEVALTNDGRVLVGYSNEGEAGGFEVIGDITAQLERMGIKELERSA